MLEAKAPGAVIFEPDEAALIDKAQMILITGWTSQQYDAAPLDVLDAVWQVHNAQKEIENWHAEQQARRYRRR